MAQKKIKKATPATGKLPSRSVGSVRAAKAAQSAKSTLPVPKKAMASSPSKITRASSVPPTALPREEPRPTAWYAAFAAALLAFSVGTYLALKTSPMGWEQAFLLSVNDWAESWYRLFVIVTFFGGTWMAVISVGLLCLGGLYRLALRLALASLGAYGVAFLAKHVIGRARPLELMDGVHARIAETGMGFPSGHATFITVFMLTLLPYLPKGIRWGIVIAAVGLVSLSRLYLGVHFPLDIIGGVAVGVGAVAFIHILPKKLQRLLRIN